VALKMLANGQYEVRNLKEAQTAINGARNLQKEIKELQEEHGILEMMQDATEMMKAATRYAVAQKKKPSDDVRIEGDGFHATLIAQNYDAHFVGTKDDLANEDQIGRKIIPLRTIIYRKFKDKAKAKEVWFAVSKRVVVKEKIEEAVAEGLLTVDEISPSFVEKTKQPYLRLYDD
jgi:hypothetical protein